MFTLSILLACSLTILAYDYGTSLSITSARNINLVVVDGRSYPLRSHDQTLEIRDLRQGYHTIKVYRTYGNYRNPSQNQRLLYEGRIYARNGYHTDIMINRFGRAYIDAQRLDGSYDNDYPYSGGYDQTNDRYRIIDRAAFQQLKATLQAEKFDQTRASIARQAITTNYFESAQVKEMLQIFNFEDSKLELAKLFYEVTADKRNYMVVYDVFTFSSSKDELARFLSAKSNVPEEF